MDVWVLIMYLQMGRAGGPAVQEFTSQKACEDAALKVRQFHNPGSDMDKPANLRWGDSWVVCVKK